MRRLFVLLACVMTTAVVSHAQDELVSYEYFKSMDSDQLRDYISTPENKEIYLDVLNNRLSQSARCLKWGARLTDITIEKVVKREARKVKEVSGKTQRKAALWNTPSSYKLEYKSINGKNDTVTVSEVIYYDGEKEHKWGVLSCHPTVTTNEQAPTGSSPLDKDISRLYDEDCFVVCPDYCGYGSSSSEQHPYLIQDVTAHNCIDGYLAALEVANTLDVSFSDDYYTYIVGYSQGGSVALACQKLYESDVYSSDDKAKINVTQTYCGDGPYSPSSTIQQYVEWANSTDSTYCKLSYPCVLPLILMAAKDAYDNDCMHTVTVEEYFKPGFLENTGCIDDINGKVLTTDEINAKIWAQGYYTIDQILSDSIIKVTYDSDNNKTVAINTETNAYKCLMRVMGKNDLSIGWTPTIPITFFHFTGDLVVPYVNMEDIKENVDSGAWTNVTLLDAKTAYDTGKGFKYDIISELEVAPYSEWNHVEVGTVFYVWFLFSDARPNNR